MRRVPRTSGPSVVLALLLAGVLWPASASAYDSLFSRLPSGHAFSTLFHAGTVRARIEDGRLIGEGSERIEPQPNGTLRITRERIYRQVRDPEHNRTVRLPEAWHAESTLLVSPRLRLLWVETRLDFHRSVDRALGYAFSKKYPELFEWDVARTQSVAGGRELTQTLLLRGKRVKQERYDYPADAVPLEIVGMVLSVAVKNHVEHFDFDLLLPGGQTHGITSDVHRTHDLRRFARGYALPRARLRPSTRELAVVDMHLTSPFKRLFFPHHFFMVFASDEPAALLAMWGGDPDDPLQAFRDDG